MKYLVAVAFVAIIGSLVMAGVFMLRAGKSGDSKTGHMMRALALRVGLSVLLFLCILAAYALGWIHPTGIPISR